MKLLLYFIFVKIYCRDPAHVKFFGCTMRIITSAKFVTAHLKISYNLYKMIKWRLQLYFKNFYKFLKRVTIFKSSSTSSFYLTSYFIRLIVNYLILLINSTHSIAKYLLSAECVYGEPMKRNRQGNPNCLEKNLDPKSLFSPQIPHRSPWHRTQYSGGGGNVGANHLNRGTAFDIQ